MLPSPKLVRDFSAEGGTNARLPPAVYAQV
jgi:hypothetical protein